MMGAVTKEERHEEPGREEHRGPHGAPGVARRGRPRALELERGLPFEEISPGDPHPPQRPHDGVDGDPGLVRKEDQREPQLPRAGHRITGDRPVVGAPGAVERRAERAEQQGHDPRRGHGEDPERRPAQGRARKHRPPRDQERQLGELHHAAAQVVDDLPERDHRERIRRRAAGSGDGAQCPGEELPVAADPPVLAPGPGQVTRRVVVEHLDVGHQPGAGEAALDQIVREERVGRKSTVGRLLEGVDVVDALPGEAALTVEVLVHVRDRGGVRVDTGVAGIDGREAGAVGAGERDTDARLQDAVTPHHPRAGGIEAGAVERVGHCSHQERSGLRREDGVGVEGDDVPDAAQHREIPEHDRERTLRAFADEVIEVGELSPLPLPAHPHALLGVEAARAVEKIEGVALRPVARVQGGHSGDGGLHDGGVAFLHLARCVGEIPEHHEVEVRAPVGEELHLQILQGLLHRLDAGEECGDQDRGARLGGNAALAEVELGQALRAEEAGDQLLDDVERDLVGR